jgi:diguanylate cyclase (GGDEF)-like protein
MGMRKGRFAAYGDTEGALARLSVLDTLAFDILPQEGEETKVAAARVRSLSSAWIYLLASQMVSILALAIHSIGMPIEFHRAGVFGALLGALGVSAIASASLRRRKTRELPPHIIVRRWAASVMVLGGLWAAAIMLGVQPGNLQEDVAIGAIWGALLLAIAAFLPIPILSLGSLITGVCALTLTSADGAVIALAAAFGGCTFAGSILNSRAALLAAGRQIASDYSAKKAARLVTEFEESGRGWFWETNADGTLTYVSDPVRRYLHSEIAGPIGTPISSLLATDGADSSLDGTLGFHLTSRLAFSDIAVKANASAGTWWSLSGSPNFDERGRFMGFTGIGTDLTEKRKAEAEINKLARFDALTGLPNRLCMRMTLEDALRGIEKQKTGCSLFLIDLDRFKGVNDTLGHPVGDALLKEVAKRLSAAIGSEGQVGRIGGDEFMAVFPSLDSSTWLGSIAQRVIEFASAPYVIEGHNISIGASVGIAIARTQYQSADALVRDADLALYAAKASGRGTHKIFSPDMHSNAQERQLLEQDLRRAIERNQLKLVYQPIVNTTTEEVIGFEALARWVHPERGYISPELFISIAEECGLITAIGDWVVRTACAEAASWTSPLRVAVNISPTHFASPALVSTIFNTLDQTGLAPARLELEITEGVFLSAGDSIDEAFRQLKSAGVRLALDDFGTGYSSLGYLKRAPLDKIKIDQSFVRGAAATGSTSEAILRAIISLAQSLKMDTTAEGVETHDDLRLIRELGCSQVQGYIFGKPVDAGEAREIAARTEAMSAEGYENARPPRFSLIRRAAVQWNGMTFDVRVRNMSTGGALIESRRLPPLGAEIQLDMPGCGSFGAEVRWLDDDRFGIKFDQPFDLALLKSAEGERRSVAAMQPNYLRAGNNPESDWAPRQRPLSLAELKRAS